MDIIVGTAGHVDHGKTSLVRALTGIDADRLPEEKKRGITIDIGFAELEVDGVRYGFIDVPGHERFVKNMLAGASGIDLVLMVIAADEGIMPQTREHFEICRLLGVRTGLIALTKTDLVDGDLTELVRAETEDFVKGSFLEGSPIIPFSSRSSEGLDELRSALKDAARKVERPPDHLIARLPIDRSFSVKGHGTVVTGTLASGDFREGADAELLPGRVRVRIRGIQSYGKTVGIARAGQRTAVNLAGVDHDKVSRGMLLADTGVLRPSNILDTRTEILPDAERSLRSRQRVRVHLGTAEVLARVAVISGLEIKPGETGFVQLRLESPAAAIAGDRFIIRSYSPQTTVGGGLVLRPTSEKVKRKSADAQTIFLTRLYEAKSNVETLEVLIRQSGVRGLAAAELRSITGWRAEIFESAASELAKGGKIMLFGPILISTAAADELKRSVLSVVDRFHEAEPLSRGISLESLRSMVFRHFPAEIVGAVLSDLAAAGEVIIEKEIVARASRAPKLSPNEARAIDSLRADLVAAGLEVPKIDDALSAVAATSGLSQQIARRLLQILLDSGEVIRVSSDFCYSAHVIESLTRKLKGHAATSSDRSIDVATFKDLAGISRKFAIPLLEYFDREKVTVRVGDKRLIR